MTALTDDTLPSPTPASGGGAVATYISLFMILFVFFIVLFSIASQQRARSVAVLTSLDAAFGHVPRAIGLIPAPRGDAGPEDPATLPFIADLNAGLTDLVQGTHPAASPRPGTILNLELPPETFFEPGTPALKPAALPALKRLAVLLQRHRGGARFSVNVAATTASAPAADRALARARVSVLAASLFAQGCPAEAVTVAVAAGTIATIRLDFLASAGDETDN